MPLHESTIKETVLLRLLTSTAFIYAPFTPILYFLFYRPDMVSIYVRLASWFVIIFLVPVGFAIIRAWFIQSAKPSRFFNAIGLRTIDPVPTGWDWFSAALVRRMC